MQKSRGITRGEVLLISGLTVLGGIILWFIATRTNARLRTQNCAANVRELAVSLAEYSYDHDSVPPPYTDIESKVAAQEHSSRTPTNSKQPEMLCQLLRIYAGSAPFFCPEDPFAGQPKYYLGIRHQFTSYALPSYKNNAGIPLSLNLIPTSFKYPLLWDATGDRQSCEDDLWQAGGAQWATNHPDGYANVALADLSIHYLPAAEVAQFSH